MPSIRGLPARSIVTTNTSYVQTTATVLPWAGSDLTLHTRRRCMHLIGVPSHLRVNSRRPRHPFPALMAGSTLALCLCTGPCQLTLSKHHETCSTCPTGTKTTLSMNFNWGITVVCLNSQDQGNLPLRHDKDGNDIRPSNELTCTGGAAQKAQQGRRNLVELQLWNLHGQRTMGIGLRTTTGM